MAEEDAAGLAMMEQGQQPIFGITHGDVGENDDNVLYIDPNDPAAAEILRQAGLQLSEDGTVTSIADNMVVHSEPMMERPITMEMPNIEAIANSAATLIGQGSLGMGFMQQAKPPVKRKRQARKSAPPKLPPQPKQQQAPPSPAKQIVQVGPDQQQVLYSVTGEDGKTQQYMMLCPKDMDQNLLIQTLVKQISSDPATKGGKKTIKITQQRGAIQKITGLPPGSRVVSQTVTPSAKSQRTPAPKKVVQTPAKSPMKTPVARKTAAGPATPKKQQIVLPTTPINNDLFNSMQPVSQSSVKNVISHAEVFESVVPDLPFEPIDGGTRVYVKCNYCQSFRSTLNGDTWESILNHILPVAKEEIQTSFYGDLGKHFIRSLRIQVNGKQIVKKDNREMPQCEVILSHSLICRKTKREFIVSSPDANFVASLAKHIQSIQPGNSGRGNSLLCIFCNSPFTHEDYLRHIQPHLDAILATLNCFAGAYCAHLYTSTIRALRQCHVCQDNEASDLRFLPCTKFSNDYNCGKKLQFAIDCFREHYGDSGFLRLNTSTVARCSVCKNSQQVYCTVFHISTQILGDEDEQQQQDVDSQLAVCINCQKQFINIVMKEQGFDERLKLFQLKNMEQLCSVLRVILNQATTLCTQKKTLIYTVHENSSNPNSAVHVVQAAEVTQLTPVTKLLALAESEITSSTTKAYFICDLCLFTADLTSLVAAEADRQKNEMLIAIVLEHLVPHTESLMNVIASMATNVMFSLKYEILSRVHDMGTFRKIVLSLQKKFKSQTSNLEVVIDKDEEKTTNQLRNGVKAEKKTFVSLKNAKSATVSPGGSTVVGDSSAGQLVEVNKFIDKQRGKLPILTQSGCNTTLLTSYTECKLCSKFSFPDFRLLAGAAANQSGGQPKAVQLCENCVETVLTLCLPTEPESLQEAEECLALGELKLMGHRLVLSNNLKKWLSLDGVNLIKKTVDDFDLKHFDCSNMYLEALKRHMSAVLKTCQRDDDITSCAAGFCITDAFLDKEKETDEMAAALASLEQQIGTPNKQKRELKPNEIQVTILSRKDKTKVAVKKQTPVTVYPRGIQRRLVVAAPQATTVTSTPKGSGGPAVIKLGSEAAGKAAGAPEKTAESSQEESVSAIQSFLDATSGEKTEVKLPAGIKITPAGKGTVNIKAISESSSPVATSTPRAHAATSKPRAPAAAAKPIVTSSPKTTPTTTKTTPAMTKTPTTTTTPTGRRKAPVAAAAAVTAITPAMRSVRDLPGVTLTANGGVRRGAQQKPKVDLSDDEGDSDDDEDDKAAAVPVKKVGKYKPPAKAAKATVSRAAKANVSSADDSAEESTPRSKRQRKEKKIFDL